MAKTTPPSSALAIPAHISCRHTRRRLQCPLMFHLPGILPAATSTAPKFPAAPARWGRKP
jgi:hypothetical protein